MRGFGLLGESEKLFDAELNGRTVIAHGMTVGRRWLVGAVENHR